jgi:7-cyano-7-deazaguanine synthase
MKKAVVLLSGGLDSATVLAMARAAGFACYALSFRYGQRHVVELRAAERVAAALGAVEHRVATVDLGWIGGSALTQHELAVPKDRPLAAMSEAAVPITYVPARNALFLCHALAWAEVLGARDLFAGMNALDYSGYPDCRPQFLEAFETMARLGTKAGAEGAQWRVRAPLIAMSKAEIICAGVGLGVDYALTHSCYDPIGERACGRCDSCLLRKKGFAEAGVADLTEYAS